MNFSMFFLQPFFFRIKKSRTPRPRESRESTAKEGSAVAKPRSMNLVSWNFVSAKKTPPQDSSASNSPENQESDQSYVSLGVRKLMRNSSQDPTAHPRERRQDDTPSSSTWKLKRSGESASSASTRKLERGDIQIGRRRSEFHIMQVSDCRSLEKVFKNLRQKLNLAEEKHQ